MNDRDRLGRAFEETFDLSAKPGFRQRVTANAVAARPQRARVAPVGMFVGGLAAAVVVIGALVALSHLPAVSPSPAVRPSPSALPPGKALTPKKLQHLASVVFRPDGTTCDWIPGQASTCPYTPRLRAQLEALHTSACLICTVPATSQTITVTGNDAIVTRNGSQQYDLHFVVEGGAALLDDIIFRFTCAGSGVSVYALTPQPAAGQQPAMPGPIPTCPASPTP